MPLYTLMLPEGGVVEAAVPAAREVYYGGCRDDGVASPACNTLAARVSRSAGVAVAVRLDEPLAVECRELVDLGQALYADADSESRSVYNTIASRLASSLARGVALGNPLVEAALAMGASILLVNGLYLGSLQVYACIGPRRMRRAGRLEPVYIARRRLGDRVYRVTFYATWFEGKAGIAAARATLLESLPSRPHSFRLARCVCQPPAYCRGLGVGNGACRSMVRWLRRRVEMVSLGLSPGPAEEHDYTATLRGPLTLYSEETGPDTYHVVYLARVGGGAYYAVVAVLEG